MLSHGQKQWLEIGMLLMQEPQLLLLDEPVAGMTDEETLRSAELLSVARGQAHADRGRARHGFRARGSRSSVTVLHEGSVLAEGSMEQIQQNEQVIEVYLGRVKKCFRSQGSISITAAVTSCATSAFEVAPATLHDAARPQRRRQDDAAQEPDGRAPDPFRQTSRSTGASISALPPYARAALGIGYVPQGREIFPRLTVEENLLMGLATQDRGGDESRSSSSSCFRC